MIQHISFNEKCDSGRVVRGLAINISQALETGEVFDNGEELEYNSIEDPSTIVGRTGDVFEAIDRQRGYLSSAKISDSSENE